MATLTSVPPETYLHSSYDPDMEYVDGRLNVGERWHSRLQTLLGILFGARETHGKFRTFAEQRIRVSERRIYRIPDICVVAMPYQREPVLVVETDLVGQIDFGELFAKLDD